MRDDLRDAHPDQWGAGLDVRGKALNVKRVSRAAGPDDVLGVCLAHNLRQGNEDHCHRSPIDKSKTWLNEVLRGPTCAVVAAELAGGILDELGIRPARSDTIMGVELVFQPPVGAGDSAFWSACLEWAEGRYQHIVSAVIHHDQKRPHMHLLALAVADGRLDGNALTAGSNRLALQRRDFLAYMREVMGLRPVRKVKTLADLAVSTGKGAKTRAAAARRDTELVHAAGAEWKRVDVGMGVDAHGGSAPEMVNPHAPAKTSTPTICATFSSRIAVCQMADVAAFQRQPSRPVAPSPKAPKRHAMPAQAPATDLQREQVVAVHAKDPEAPTQQAATDDDTDARRDRECEQAASQWCE